MTEKIYISWQDVHQQTKNLAQKIKQIKSFKRIVAISRGGLLPAGILAYELDIRDCYTINSISYDGENKRDDISIKTSDSGVVFDKDTLVIDDLADSGRTLQQIRKLYPEVTLACIYAKPEGIKSTDLYALAIENKWVVFPWD